MEQMMSHFSLLIPLFTNKIHHRIPFFPVIQINEGIFMFLNLLIIVTIFIVGAFVFLEMKWTKNVIFILSIIEIIYALFPILLALHFRKYFPGTISSIFVLFFGVLILFTISAYKPQEVNLEE